MDFAVLLKALSESQAPWILLSGILIFLLWDTSRRDEKSVRHSLDLLAASFEDFVKRFGVHDARSERIQETLVGIAARKERS